MEVKIIKAFIASPSDAEKERDLCTKVFAEINAGKNVKIVPGLNYVNLEDSSALQLPVLVKFYVDPKFNLTSIYTNVKCVKKQFMTKTLSIFN